MPRLTLREKILRDRLRRLRRTFPGVRRGDSESIHAARTSTRRLRALLPLLALDPRSTRKLTGRLRRAGRRLGRLRDIDTQLLLVGELQRLDDEDGTLLPHLHRSLSAKRAGVYERLTERKFVRRLERLAGQLLADSAKTVAPAERERALLRAANAHVVRRVRALRGGLDEAGTIYDADRLHQVRILVKKLRYSAEVTADAEGYPGASDLRRLRRVQDVLGRLHDVKVLLDRIQATERRATSPDIVKPKEYSRVVNLLETRCRRLHGRFLRERTPLIGLCRRLASSASAGSKPVRGVR